MTRRRVYIQLGELEYRALSRLALLRGMCVGEYSNELVRHAIASGLLLDESFCEWYAREERACRFDEQTAYPLRRRRSVPGKEER